MSRRPAARLAAVSRQYRAGTFTVAALNGIDLTIPHGTFMAVVGPSGSGKSTLLHLLGCLDRPDGGHVEIAGQDTGGLDDDARAAFRATHIGFVFQSFNLVPVLTALENVEQPLQLLGLPRLERLRQASEALRSVGLGGLEGRLPSELSGGQQQRVAIARALVKRPSLVLADEPTANLDQQTGAGIIALLQRLQRAEGTTVVCCSHDPRLIAEADLSVQLVDGRLQHAPRH